MSPNDSSADEAEQAAAEFQPYADALQLEPGAPLPEPTEEETEHDAQLVAAGLKNYAANRPGPESFPGMALQVINMLGKPDASIDKLSVLVSREPALTAALLRVVNSAVYRGVSNIVSVRDAIARLGLNEAARVAGATATKVLFDFRSRASTLPFVADFEQLYLNAVTTAVTAGFLASQRTPTRTDRCYLGGLLHDIGRSVSLRALATLREQGASELAPKSEQTYRVVEALHIPIGTDCLNAWQLPEFVVEMANSHHTGNIAAADTDVELHIVAFSSALQLLRSAPQLHPTATLDLLASARALKLTPEMVKKLDAERAKFEARARTLSNA